MMQIGDEPTASMIDQVVDARRREMGVEHLLFGALRFVSGCHLEWLDQLGASLAYLWNRSEEAARDDGSVRDIVRRFIESLRAEA